MTTQPFSQEYAGSKGAAPAGDGRDAVGRPARRSLLQRVGDFALDWLEQYGRHARMAGSATQLPVEPDTWLPWTGFPSGPARWHQNRYRW